MKRNQSLTLLLPAALMIFASGALGQTIEISVSNAGVSEPMINMQAGVPADGTVRENPLRPTHLSGPGNAPDTAVQTGPVIGAATVTPVLNFEGLGAGFPGFTVSGAPPQANGVAGASQYLQWVNNSFELFNKTTGAPIIGPLAGNQLFVALGGTHPCAANNDGDPIAQYDKSHGRWVLSQFAISSGPSGGYWECVAVSQTSDAAGAYNVYAFQQPNLNDSPRVSVWSNGYYATYLMFSSTGTYKGPRICAMDGAAMRAGAAATQQCVQLAGTFGPVLSSDLDGSIAPPAGTDPYFVALGTNLLNVWRYHVDFANPANTVLRGRTTTAVAAFTFACNGGTCIPQRGTTQQLDSVGDRVMYRFAYRHFADGHEALVVNHSVNPGAQVAGVRWYELRPNPANGGLTLFQQGTFAPADGVNRWMGSVAQDKAGNMVAGYSASSSAVFPSIRIANRTAADPAGTLGNETTIIAGTGSQGPGSGWGPLSALTVDPSDDCLFWYTNEYLTASSSLNWHTRIASFKLANCI